MACRIIRDSNKEIVSVLAPNGEPSQLFGHIMVHVNDTEEALDIYRSINSDYKLLELKETKGYTDSNQELRWNTIKDNYINNTVSESSIVDKELLQDLVDNGHLNCE